MSKQKPEDKISAGAPRLLHDAVLPAFFVMSWMFSVSVLAQQIEKIPADVFQKVQADGVARVMVGLNVPWSPEKAGEQSQQNDVTNAIARLKKELSGTPHKVLAEWQFIPGVALEIGPAALQVLAASALVYAVRLEQKYQPMSGPLIERDGLRPLGLERAI